MLYVKIIVTELSNKEVSKSYRLHALQLIPFMFIYNTELTLKLYTDTNTLIPLCQNFFSSLKKYTETEQYRICIYGITSLIGMDHEKLPDVIKSGKENPNKHFANPRICWNVYLNTYRHAQNPRITY